jgi:GAF domain-containing protein/CheY-like chemotaxis protein
MIDEVQITDQQTELEALRQRVAELETAREQAETLRAVTQALSTTLDLQEVFELILTELQKVVPYDSSSVQRLQDNRLVIVGGRGFENLPELLGLRFDPWDRDSPSNEVIRTRRPHIVEDVSARYSHFRNRVHGKGRIHGWMGVPLLFGDRMIGMISLDKHEAGFYTPEHARLALAFAAQGAAAIENARLYDESLKARETAEILQEANIALTQNLSLDAIFETLLDYLGRVVPYDSVSIFLREGETRLTARAVRGYEKYPGAESAGTVSFEFTNSPHINQVVKQQSSLIIPDTAEFPDWVRVPSSAPVRNWLAVPLVAGARTIGLYSLDKTEPNFFTGEHRRMAEALAAQAVIAIQNAMQFERESAAHKKAERRSEQLNAINRIAQAATSVLDLNSVLEVMAREMMLLLNARSAGAALLNPERTELQVVAYASQSDEPPAIGLRIPLAGNIATQQVIETGRPVLITGAQNSKLQDEATRAVFRARNTHCILIAPLLARGEVIGTIGPDIDQPDRVFTPEEVELAETVASQMAGVIENSRLLDETQRLLKETEDRNGELAIINSVQQGLASKLEMQAIYNLVGEKIRDIFQVEVVYIAVRHPGEPNSIDFPYYVDRDKILHAEPLTLGEGLTSKVILEQRALLLGTLEEQLNLGAILTEDERSNTYLGVPIMIGDFAAGVVSVQSYQTNAFSGSDIRLLETLANSMGVALENARLFNAEQQRVAELVAISKVNQALVAEPELDSVIQLIGNQMLEIFDADIVYVALLDRRTDLIHFPYQYGEEFTTLKLGEGLTSKIIETAQPLLIKKDVDKRRKEIGATRVGRDVLSFLGVPIKAGGETIGVISVQSTTQEQIFDDDSIRLLTTIASSAGAAIQNAQLHAETQRRAREMATLAEVGRDISASLEASIVLEGIARHAKELLKGSMSALFLPERDGATFRAFAAVGEEADYLSNDTIHWGEGILGSIAKNKTGEIVNDTNSDPRVVLIKGTQAKPDEHLLAVPLLADDELKGLMAVWRTGKGLEFTEFELEFLNNLARQAVIAIKNTQLFEEVKEARAAAEAANEAKSAFLAGVSHELRTPLTSVLGFAKIIQKRLETRVFPHVSMDNPKVRSATQQISENLAIIVSEGERLTSLINNLLDLAKIESGKLEWRLEELDIADVLRRAISATASLFEGKEVSLVEDLPENLPLIHGDRNRLIQVVINLISNAVKFTERGTVTCRVRQDDGEILVSISDTGMGIPEDYLEKVFEKFVQVGDTLSNKPKGTGLGLPICKEIIEHHGGRIWVESRLGQGSTFSFTLPAGPIPELEPQTVDLEALIGAFKAQVAEGPFPAGEKPRQILVVDDDAHIREMLRQELETEGYRVQEARDGLQAIGRAKAALPDLVILDVRMPGMNGFDAAAVLKNNPETMGIPIMILSIVEDRERGYRLGVDRYLTKPIDTATLLGEVQALLENGPAKRNILVADENIDTVRALTGVLHARDYRVLEATSQEEFFEKAYQERPDLVLVNAGFSDQGEIVKSLRYEKGLENIVILFYQHGG